MKKILVMILTLLCLCVGTCFIGCHSEDSQTSSQEQSFEKQTSSQEYSSEDQTSSQADSSEYQEPIEEIPIEELTMLLMACKQKYPNETGDFYVVNYYGKYASGAIVAKISNIHWGYTAACWTEKIEEYYIKYNDGNNITVLYEGEFYTLTQSYENGYLTIKEIANVESKNREFYPYMYEEQDLYEYKDLMGYLRTTADKVTLRKYPGSLAPGTTFITTITSSAQEDIDTVLEYISELTLTEISASEGEVAGGGATVLTFYTSQGDAYTLSEGAKKYHYRNRKYYVANVSIPEFSSGEITYNFLSYSQECQLFIDSIFVAEYHIPFETMELKELSSENGFNEAYFDALDRGYVIKFDAGELRVFSANLVGYKSGRENGEERYFEIVGNVDFAEIFTE